MSLFRRLREEPFRYQELAQYNAEVARGLVHTEEWKAKMAEQQRQFDAERRRAHRASAEPK